DKVSISLSKEAVMVSYKPGAAFRPKELREALKRSEVGVVQMQISVRGHLERRQTGSVFVAGRDRFTIPGSPVGLPLPPDVPMLLEGIVNDLVSPMELKVLTF